MATRHLTKTLSDCLSAKLVGHPSYIVLRLISSPHSVPIMALVDSDAYGLDILSVYKYGSRALQHENAKLSARRVKWLGIWSSEIARYVLYHNLFSPTVEPFQFWY